MVLRQAVVIFVIAKLHTGNTVRGPSKHWKALPLHSFRFARLLCVDGRSDFELKLSSMCCSVCDNILCSIHLQTLRCVSM